ncbi:MAG: flagellar basal body protein [Cyanobacteriota bacterium]
MNVFLKTFDSLNITGKMLTLLSNNNSVITNNISNSDTPGYVKQNTNFEQVMGSIRSPIETPLAKRMGPNPMLVEDGGKVVLEEEITNMQRNFLLYNLVTRRAGSLVTTIKSMAQVGR